MHLAKGNKALRSGQVEEGGSIAPWEWAGPSILQELVMRKAVGRGPRMRRRRPSLGSVDRAPRGPAGQKPRDAVGGWEVRFRMEWGQGVGLDSEGEGSPPGSWSPDGRRGTGAETCRSISHTDRDSRVCPAVGRQRLKPPLRVGGRGPAWPCGSGGRESRSDGCAGNRRAGRAAGSDE